MGDSGEGVGTVAQLLGELGTVKQVPETMAFSVPSNFTSGYNIQNMISYYLLIECINKLMQ